MTNTLTQSTLTPKAQLFTLALAALVAPATTAFSASGTADVGTNYITDGTLMVPVGNPGNAPDPANTDKDNNPATGHGEVPYEYSIGKYEVTNAQYVIFLNAVDPTGGNSLALYNNYMSSTYGGIEKTDGTGGVYYAVKSGNADNGMAWADMPVNYVSFWDAARFCNWLTNGGTEGANTETGMYALNGEMDPTNASITRQLSGTGYAVSSEDEWYKAAYYNGDAGTYREYPVTTELSQEVANYYNSGFVFESPNLAEVDYYDGVNGAASYYGTFQQGGNVFEWNDTIINGHSRGMRGGSYTNLNGNGLLCSSDRYYAAPPAYEDYSYYGFRVTSLAVPEPSTYGILGGAAALLGAVALRRRNRRD